jgi:hypothetical protein
MCLVLKHAVTSLSVVITRKLAEFFVAICVVRKMARNIPVTVPERT